MFSADSSTENDTLFYQIDLRPLPIGPRTKFDFENTWGKFESWTFNNAYPAGDFGVKIGISPNLLVYSKALDSLGQGIYTNWVNPRYNIKDSFNDSPSGISFDSILAMGYEGINCTQPNDGERILRTTTIGPIGANAKIQLKYLHGLYIPGAITVRDHVQIRSEDTIYIETSSNDGQSWDVIQKLHSGNQSQAFTSADVEANVLYPAGTFILARVRYASKYQPLLATPYPKTSLFVVEFNVNSSPFVDNAPILSSEMEESVISVFPNPSNGIFTIQGLKDAGMLEVMDLQGKRIKLQLIAKGNGQMDMSDIQNGIYLIRIQTNKGVVVKKIIKSSH